MRNKILLFLIVFGLFTNQIKAQLVVNNSNTVAYYVQNVLLGSGVTVSNITFNGVAGSVSNPQLGEFNGTSTTPFLGINNGIIMATGDVSVAVGPNNTGSASAGGGNLGFGDADLDQLEGTGVGTNDAAILEFDFIPTGDTVKFKFVFGSEEYPEYVGNINDAFGFFLSGPGIAGPYTNGAINIALVPGTSTPVTINTVNSGSNPSYYVDNTINTGGQSIQFDGYTTVMTAIAPVQCGVQFHIKIAIADASDADWDSGVFLEGGSFSSNNTMDATTAVVPSDVFICNAPFNVSFSSGPTPPPNSYWDFGDGIGTSTQQNPTYTYADSGSYTVMFIASDPSPCVLPDTAWFNVTIIQTGAMTAAFDIPPYNPCDTNLTINLEYTGTGEDSLYWDLGDGTTSNDTLVTHTYTTNGDYIVTFMAWEYACGGFTTIYDTVHFNPVFTTVQATNPGPIELCGSPYNVNFASGATPLQYTYWDFGDGDTLGIGNDYNPMHTYADTGVYTVTYMVIDSNTCNITDAIDFLVVITQSEQLSALFSIPPFNDCQDSLTIQLAFTGSGADSLYWDLGDGTFYFNDTMVNHTYTTTGNFPVLLHAYDFVCNYDSIFTDTVRFNPVFTSVNAVPPAANQVFCVQPYEVTFDAGATPPPNNYWDFGDGVGTSTFSNPQYTYADTGTYTIMYVAIDSSTCNTADTAWYTVQLIKPAVVDAQFTIPPYNNCQDSLPINLQFTGSGADSLYWDMGNGTTFIDSTTINYTYITYGNYVITFEAYDLLCNTSDTLTQIVDFNPVYTAVNAQPIDSVFSCGSLVVDFIGNTPSPPQNYWDFGDGQNSTFPDPTHTYATDGFYTVTYVAIDTTTCNKYDSLTFTVELVQAPSVNPTINFEPPKPCEMDSFVVDLQFSGSGVDSIAWIMGDGAIFTTNSVHYLYSAAGTYNIVLMVYNELCPHDPVSVGEIQFLDISETSGIIPNVFTPNGDNWNDELVFVGIDNTQDFSIKIFDRWGRLQFESTDATKHWDGKDASEGTYFYELRYTDVCSSVEKLKTGTVTLLRGPKK